MNTYKRHRFPPDIIYSDEVFVKISASSNICAGLQTKMGESLPACHKLLDSSILRVLLQRNFEWFSGKSKLALN
jgi:hypothetical protein